jgi:hypothetical protein
MAKKWTQRVLGAVVMPTTAAFRVMVNEFPSTSEHHPEGRDHWRSRAEVLALHRFGLQQVLADGTA